MPDRCRTCKAPIRWAKTVAGEFMPLDLEPDDTGEWTLAMAPRPGGSPRAIHVPETRRAAYAGSLYRVHWATCPDADQHRRQR